LHQVFKNSFVITKTPLRISFYGGGTDMPYFFNKHSGKTISATINKFIYVTVKIHSNFKEKYRLNYYETEIVSKIDDIKDNTKAIPNLNETRKRSQKIKFRLFKKDEVQISQIACDFVSKLLNKNFYLSNPINILVDKKKNLGFTGSANFAFKYALDHGYDAVNLINQDIIFPKKTIPSLIKIFRDCKIKNKI
jgi:hypothetical protein